MAYRRPEPLAKRHRLDAFACGEPALDQWLMRHARSAQASDSARVYVATTEDGETVVGPYALAAAQVAPQDATAWTLRGQPRGRPVPAIILARLAVDRRHQRAGVGRSLLQDALLRCATAAEAIGARLLLVHEKFGFQASPTDPLHLQLLMKDLRAQLGLRTEASR